MPEQFFTTIRRDPKKNVTGIVVPPEIVPHSARARNLP
jgi:hypothetical protein